MTRSSPIRRGETIRCPRCNRTHAVLESDPPLLLLYECDGRKFLVGANTEARHA